MLPHKTCLSQILEAPGMLQILQELSVSTREGGCEVQAHSSNGKNI